MQFDRPSSFQCPVDDTNLAKIAAIVLLEAKAKAYATGALKALSAHSYDQWVATDKWQFKQVMEDLLDRLRGRPLYELAEKIEVRRSKAQELRHSIVHSVWGEQDGRAFAYDFRREREIELSDLDAALIELDELCVQSQSLVLEVGRLLRTGEITQPHQDERGPSVRVDDEVVRL